MYRPRAEAADPINKDVSPAKLGQPERSYDNEPDYLRGLDSPHVLQGYRSTNPAGERSYRIKFKP